MVFWNIWASKAAWPSYTSSKGTLGSHSCQTCPRLASWIWEAISHQGKARVIGSPWGLPSYVHLFHLVHPFIDLFLTLHGWRIMVNLVLLLATLQVLKLFHHKVHVLPQLDLTSYMVLSSSWMFMGSSVFECFPPSAIVMESSDFLWLRLSYRSNTELWCCSSGMSSMLTGYRTMMGLMGLDLELLAWVSVLGSFWNLLSDLDQILP